MRDKIYILEFNINDSIMMRAGYFLVIFILILPAVLSNVPAQNSENYTPVIITSGQYGKGYRFNIRMNRENEFNCIKNTICFFNTVYKLLI